MNIFRRLITSILFLSWAPSALAQIEIPRFAGLWCPRAGSRAVYSVAEKLGEVDTITLSVTGHFQIGTTYTGLDHHSVVQRFRQAGVEVPVVEAVLVEEPGISSRLLPPALWRGGGPPILAVQAGTPIGQETLVVPAGSFDCAHYKLGEADVWLSPRVSPYGIVAYRESGLTLELASYFENLDGENR